MTGGKEMVISDVLCVPILCKIVSLMVVHKMSILFEDGHVSMHISKFFFKFTHTHTHIYIYI